MPLFDSITVEDIKADVLTRMSQLEIDTREGSFADEMAGPMALEIWKVYQSLGALEPIVFVNENSGEYLLRECEKYGIERKAGTPATATLTVTGEPGAAVPAGSLFLTAAGLQFRTSHAAVLRGGQADITAQSTETGESCNVLAGEINRQLVSIPGVRAVTNREAAAGGTDPETFASLFRRLDARRKNPTTSGNVSHYYEWALETDGIGDAKIFPCIDGPGSVGVRVVGSDYRPIDDTDADPNTVFNRCKAHILEEMPIGPELNIASAGALKIDVAVKVWLENAQLEDVQAAFEQQLEAYLRSVCFERYELPISRFIWLLGSIDGVVDYRDMTLNGEDANVRVGAHDVPVLGTVTLTLMDSAARSAAGAVTGA